MQHFHKERIDELEHKLVEALQECDAQNETILALEETLRQKSLGMTECEERLEEARQQMSVLQVCVCEREVAWKILPACERRS